MKKNKIFLIFTIFLLCIDYLLVCDERLGDELYKKAKFRYAAEEYIKSLESSPNSGELILKIASAYEGMKWYSESNKYLKIYLDKFPDASNQKEIKDKLAYGYRWIGYNFYMDENFDSAIEELKKAVSLNENFIDAYHWLARIYLEKGDFDSSMRTWQKILIIDPQNELAKWFLKDTEGKISYGAKAYEDYRDGYNLYSSGKRELAIKKFEESFYENNKFSAAAYWIARINFETGEYEESIKWWEKVIEIDNTNEKAKFFLRESKRKIEESKISESEIGKENN